MGPLWTGASVRLLSSSCRHISHQRGTVRLVPWLQHRDTCGEEAQESFRRPDLDVISLKRLTFRAGSTGANTAIAHSSVREGSFSSSRKRRTSGNGALQSLGLSPGATTTSSDHGSTTQAGLVRACNNMKFSTWTTGSETLAQMPPRLSGIRNLRGRCGLPVLGCGVCPSQSSIGWVTAHVRHDGNSRRGVPTKLTTVVGMSSFCRDLGAMSLIGTVLAGAARTARLRELLEERGERSSQHRVGARSTPGAHRRRRT